MRRRTVTAAALLATTLVLAGCGSNDAPENGDGGDAPDAQNVAAYIDSKPRPAFPFKDRDYRVEKLPSDAVYYNRLQTKLSAPGGQ